MGKKITKEMINDIRKFKRDVNVEKVIVFGSYATGNAKEDSDIDLILVGKKFMNKDFHSRFKGLWLKWKLNFPVDFLCYTPEEFEARRTEPTIVKEAIREGIEI